MASRQSKGAPIKKAPDANQSANAPPRRPNAWNRGAPQIPPFNPNRGQNGYSPSPQGQTNGKHTPTPANDEAKDRLLASLAGSLGSIITVTMQSGARFEGILTSVSSSGEDAAISLKDAKDLSIPGAPIQQTLSLPAANIRSYSPGAAAPASNKNTDGFRTDVEISRTSQPKRERELQAWQPDPSTPDPTMGTGQHGDDITFGANSGGTWDQFAANEEKFGITTRFDENVYTTKLDRSAKDFKERERKAERIAAEITGAVSNNPHIAEERGFIVDDSGVNEEDKYGAVVRGVNAYIPPGARRAMGNQAPSPAPAPTPSAPGASSQDKGKEAEKETKPEVPKVSVNAPDGTEKTLTRTTASPPVAGFAKQPPADAAFRDFVTNEKQRLTQKKQALVKNEMEKRVAELVKFSQSFKLNKPIPEDLVPILAKDEEKQKQIREKSTMDAQSSSARTIGIAATTSTASATPGKVLAAVKSNDPPRKPPVTATAAMQKLSSNLASSKSSAAVALGSSASNATTASAIGASGGASSGAGKLESSKTVPRISMVIQPIPPFKGKKQGTTATEASNKPTTASTAQQQQPMSPTTAQRLNVNATSFRPNPKAAAFTPNGSTSGASSSAVSPKPSKAPAVPPSTTPNPFFGTQTIKKNPPVNVKDEFNPFKASNGKLPEPSAISATWPYNGKRYTMMFPPPPAPQPQASPHMTPHHPPPPPPPSYDEDAAAQAATRGYAVYAYAPYAYGQPPHQPMMPGMPGVPPGAFVHSPYMQPMPYPPNMPPPNGQPMYAPPPMGQMPPPQAYMPPPPPPGAYPPPPNGGAPRPSMPPTPIPAHAHPYYHQSPQLQHAVPYPMMMPPPQPGAPPHPYEAGPPPPPVPMGGVGHA